MKHSIKERAKYVPLETKLKVLNEMMIQSMLIDMKVIPDGFWSDEKEEKYGGFRKFAEKLTKAQMKTITEMQSTPKQIEAEKGKELPTDEFFITWFSWEISIDNGIFRNRNGKIFLNITEIYEYWKKHTASINLRSSSQLQSLPKEPTPELRDELIKFLKWRESEYAYHAIIAFDMVVDYYLNKP